MHIALLVLAAVAGLLFVASLFPNTPSQPLQGVGGLLLAICIYLLGG